MSAVSRRDWMRAAALAVVGAGAARGLGAQTPGRDSARATEAGTPTAAASAAGADAPPSADAEQGPTLGGRGDVGTLADPNAAGRPAERATSMDNNAAIRDLELSLKCPCPCGLDVYTCRTTDFTCTYSPEAHRQVIGYVQQGMTAQQIRDAFVAQYGERALMAPIAKGFNLAGYLVPGIAVLTAGAALTFVLLRRNRLAAAGAPAELPLAGMPSASRATPAVTPTADELEQLRRALADDQ